MADRFYKVISGDGHVETPPETWVKYVPEKWRDRAPRLIHLPDGGEGWVVEGQPLLHNGQNIIAGKPIRFRGMSYYNEDGSAATGAGSAEQRLREQDQDGIDAEVLFPPVFASRFLEGIADPEVYLSMIQAYNTFLAQDFNAVAPDRLIGNAVIPVSGIKHAVAELKRVKDLGIRSVAFYQFPNGTGSPADEDDEFWETALDIDMKLSPHFGFGDIRAPMGGAGRGTGSQPFASALCQRAGSHAPVYCMSQLIAAGVLDRFPGLEMYFAETNASWLPFSLFFMDDNYQLFKDWFGVTLQMKPSEYVTKHFYFGIVRDPIIFQMQHLIPWDRIMWGSDFPHSVGSFPKSAEFFDTAMADVSDDLRRKILLDVPAAFFDLDLNKPITATPG